MFPLTISGKIQAPQMDPEASGHTCARLKQQLALAEATEIESGDGRVSFRVKPFRHVSRFNILVSIDAGSIEVIQGSPGQLRYHFSCRRYLLIACGLAMFLGLVVWLSDHTPKLAAGAGLFTWVWLFAVNYVFSSLRLRRFVKAAIYRK